MKNGKNSRWPFAGRRLRWLGFEWVIVLAHALVSTSAEPITPQGSAQSQTAERVSPKQYRRIYVPENKVDSWPIGNEKYLPVESKEFEAWVDNANRAWVSARSIARVERAEYEATLDDDGTLRGRGQWQISIAGEEVAFLQLPSGGIGLKGARWLNAVDQPVRLGLWGASGNEAKQLALQIPKSGTVEFEWFLPSQPRGDVLEFPWKLPVAAHVQVTLDLPVGKRPQIDSSALIDQESPAPAAEPAKSRHKWKLIHGPLTDAVLRINSIDPRQPEAESELSWQEDCDYSIDQKGLTLRVNCVLQGPINEKREVAVPLGDGVQLISAAVNGQELAWHVARGISPLPNKAIITLPAASEERSLHMSFEAWQPLTVGQHWRLPVLRAEGVRWSAGRSQIRIREELELLSLAPIECQQTGVAQSTSDSVNTESLSFTAFTSDSTVDLVVAHRQPDATVRAGSSIALADPDVTGKLMTEWQVTRSHLHRLTGELMPGWSVDTVETIPADAMAEWFIDRSDKKRRIEIRLTHGVSPARNVTVIIMARLQRFSLADPLTAGALRMVRWEGARLAQHLLSFQSSEPYSIETVGELPVVAATTLDAGASALLDSPLTDRQIINLVDATESAGLRLAFKRGRYSIEEQVDVRCADASVETTYRLRVLPKSAPIDRIWFSTTEPIGSDVRWIERQSGLPVLAERLPADASSPSKGAESWLLRLPKPSSEPMDLVSQSKKPLSHAGAVPLLTFPEAVDQHGLVLLRNSGKSTPEIISANMSAIPPPEVEHEAIVNSQPGRLLAAFRFAPALLGDSDRSPSLQLRPAHTGLTANPIIQYFDLETFVWPDGRTAHRATYRLQTNGAMGFQPPLPDPKLIRGIVVEGTPVDPADLVVTQPVVIPLSRGARTSVVTVFIDGRQQPLSAVSIISPPNLCREDEMLAGRWTIWLPDGYLAMDESREVEFGSWQSRLFGPLAQSDRPRIFNPLSINDWPGSVQRLFRAADRSQAESAITSQLPTSERVAMPVVFPDAPGLGFPSIHSSGVVAATSFAPFLEESARLPGWRPFQQTFLGGNAPAAMRVQNSAVIRSMAGVLMISSFLLGQRYLRPLRIWLMSLVMLITLSFVLPTAMAPLATGLTWGVILCRIFQFPTIRSWATASPYSTGNSAVRSAMTLMAVAALAQPADAEPRDPVEAPAAAPQEATIERVLIPIDRQKRQVGTRYYVRDGFIRELLGRDLSGKHDEHDWLLTTASYQGQVTQASGQAEYSAGVWTLAFAVETKAKQTRIVLPVVRSEATWQPTAMLDGVPVAINWAADERTCQISVDEPGKYSLTLYCTPKSAVMGDGNGEIHLSVPPLPSAAITLKAPDGLADLRVSKALLSRSAKDTTNVHTGVLVNSDHLHVRWAQRMPANATAQGLNVSELNWLHVDSRGVELESKYILEGGARRPDYIEVKFDDRWKPDRDPLWTVVGANGAGGEKPTLHIPLAADDTVRTEVRVRWKLRDPVTIGNLRLPPVGLISSPASQRWFAASADGSRDIAIVDSAANATTAKEFMSRWGAAGATTPPQVAFGNVTPHDHWTISVRPHEVESAVREVVYITAEMRRLRVIYQAHVSPGALNRFQYSIHLPRNVAIEEVNVAEADRQIPTRYVYDVDNRLNVFFGEGVRSDYRLTLIGSVPVEPNLPMQIPRVSTAPGGATSPQVQLYRADDVDVQLEGLSASATVVASQPDLPPVQSLVRSLGVYHFEESAARDGRITVKPSSAQLNGDALVGVEREGGGWSVTLSAELVVRNGNLDTFRIRIPSSCPGPYEFESNVPATTEVVAIDSRSKEFKVRFAAPLLDGGTAQFRWRSPVTIMGDSPVFVPDIGLPTAFLGQRFVSVPKSIDGRAAAWSTTGVKAAKAPAVWESAVRSDQNLYEVIADQFAIVGRPQSLQQSMPRIRLAETAVSRGAPGREWTVSRFVLLPDGISDCEIAVPTGHQLVQVELDGRPALISAAATNRWQVHLNSPRLPEVLTVVTRAGDLQSANNDLRRPGVFHKAASIPIELSLWSLIQPLNSEMVVDGVSPVATEDLAALRFDRYLSIAEAAGKLLAMELPGPDGTNWMRPWRALLQSVQTQSLRTLNRALPASSVAQVSQPSEEQITGASARLTKWQQENSLVLNLDVSGSRDFPTAVDSAADLWTAFLEIPNNHTKVLHYAVDGDADSLQTRGHSAARGLINQRMLALLIAGGVFATAVWSARIPMIVEAVYRWPQALGVLAGVFYWMFLWPSVIGLLIILLSVWLAFRDGWPGQSFRAEASTVVRSHQMG